MADTLGQFTLYLDEVRIYTQIAGNSMMTCCNGIKKVVCFELYLADPASSNPIAIGMSQQEISVIFSY